MLIRSCRSVILRQIISNEQYFLHSCFYTTKINNCTASSCITNLKFNHHVPSYYHEIFKMKNSDSGVAKILFLNKFLRNFSTDISTTFSSGTSNNDDFHEFRSISPQNKKIISKHLGLKSSFLNETNIFVSTDLNKLVFNYYFSTNFGSGIKIFPVYYEGFNRNVINNNYLRNGVIKEFFSLNDQNPKQKCPEFLFYIFDKCVPQNFNLQNLNEELLVIFDDIFDALAFYQQTKLPTIAVKLFKDNSNPNDSFKEFCKKLDNHFKKIYMWPKPNSVFETLRKRCLENFESRKIYFLNSVSTPSKILYEDPKEKFDSVLQNAIPFHHPYILNFQDLKEDVFIEFNDPTINGVQWSRFLLLNEYLKGHRAGELTIITGPTGCGKTTFASEYSLDLCMQGVPTLWGSFEIKNVRLIKIMMTQFARKNLSFSNKEDFDNESENFSKLPLYFMKFHGQTEVELFMIAAKHAVLALGIKHIIIDNLQFMLGMNVESNYDRFLKQDFLISSLRQFSTDYNCHITLVAHPRKEKEEITLSNNSLYGGIKASQEADNVLIIMNKFNARYRCNKYIQITKNRFNGCLGVLPLFFDKTTLCFSSSSLNSNIQPQHHATKTVTSQEIRDNNVKSDYVSEVYRMRYLFEN